MKNKEALYRTYRAILEMNQRNRTVSSAYGTEISIGASGVLTELMVSKSLTPSDIAFRLMIDRVTTTRLLHQLRNEKLISEQSDASDGRRKLLSITKRGASLFEKMRERQDATFRGAFDRLSSREQGRFSTLLKRFLVTLESIPAAVLSEDPPLMREVRRLSRGIGLLGNNFFCQSQASPLEWHTLSQARYSPRGISSKDLCIRFSVQPTTVSSCVARLDRRKLITRIPHKSDRRMHSIVTTEKGNRFLESLETHAVSLFADFTAGMSSADLDELSQLFAIYTGAGDGAEFITLAPHTYLQVILSEENHQELRAFVMKARVEQGKVVTLQNEIISPDNLLFGVFVDGKVAGVFEFKMLGRGAKVVCIHAFVLKSVEASAGRAIDRIIDHLKVAFPMTEHLVCARADCSEVIVRALVAASGGAEVRITVE